ncbi:multicopper oxidase family protein [Streptomyces sp. 1331.2]|uniref:multicopper oxidase family protein n=1 Tax=Streptomyces sp. 1331.2 TaxID=1938835 RepID=UPI000BD947F0|nr:multicopper oxidase domain-containing protein [Streptomyces sp. 1331.2]SOB81165.1 Multicopper oxidase with three cupredoxin domains (includes cell division protein FtsP and spore coat protein CotA) [Streptomyces sp. 1331.2]
MNRRRFLGIGVSALGAGALAAVAAPSAARLFAAGQPGRLLTSELDLPEAFRIPLPVPPVLQPVRTDGTTDYYEITQQVAELEILPGVKTQAWTYGGSFPGPTVVTRAGRTAVVKHRNELPVPSVTHLHGGHTPADSDGYPVDLLLPVGSATDADQRTAGTAGMSGMPGTPGATGTHGTPGTHEMHGMPGMRAAAGRNVVGERSYTYPGKQRAATLWYHDHRMGFTGPGVWRGLAGFHLVHDDAEDALPLPRGERDLPLMIADRSFAADGSFRYPAVDPSLADPGVTGPYANGVLGDVLLVNGAPWPRLDVDRARYRLRLLNASNARPYRLELDPQPAGGGALVQIGSDGGLLAAPVAHDGIQIAPAERFDVVVDFSRYEPGTQVRLVNRLGSDRTAEVMRFDVSSKPVKDDAMVPDKLVAVEALDPAAAVTTRDFAFRRSRGDGWTVNGDPYQPGRSIAAPALGTVERWRFSSDLHHPVHVHLDHFQVIGRNGGDPGPFDAGWKDTVDLRPAEAVEVLVRFTDYAGTYMLHCHNLEHEDMAMMADFTVR